MWLWGFNSASFIYKTVHMNRRTLLKGLATFSAIGFGTATYGVVIEAGLMLNTTAYAFTPPKWTPGLKLRAVVIADPHVVEPWFPVSRWQNVLEAAQALNPDIIFMLGDYITGMRLRTSRVPVKDIAAEAAKLHAPLGVYSINGNHDYWGDFALQRIGHGKPAIQMAFEDVGIPVLTNKAVRLMKDGLPFWVTGTDSIIAFFKQGGGFDGRDDLPGTLVQVTDDAPIIHLAHEPDMFARMPERVSLTLSGHTHGGQVVIAGHPLYVPSAYGRRYRYGHIVEDGKHLIVSGGLGCSTLPIRIGSPPEINLLELG